MSLTGASLDDAKGDYARLLTERDDDRLRPLGLTPTLAQSTNRALGLRTP